MCFNLFLVPGFTAMMLMAASQANNENETGY